MDELEVEIDEPISVRSWCRSRKWPILAMICMVFIWPVYLTLTNRAAARLMANNNETIYI